MTDLENFLATHGVSRAKKQPSTARKGGSSTMSMTKTVIRKSTGTSKGSSKTKTSPPSSGAGSYIYAGSAGNPTKRSGSRKGGKVKKGLYVGQVSNRRIQIRKAGSLGGGFSMPGMEKFIKPGLLVTAGALGFKTLDKLFLNDFLEKDKKSVLYKYSPEFKTVLALAAGLGIAGFSKNQNVKLVGLGVAVSQLVDYGAEKIVGGLTTSVKSEKTDTSSSSASSASGMGGLRRVGNPFQIGSGLVTTRGASRVSPVSSPAVSDSGISSSSSGNQFAV